MKIRYPVVRKEQLHRTFPPDFDHIKISVVKQPELLKQRCGDLCASTVKTNKWNFLNFVTSEVKHYFKLYYKKNTFFKYRIRIIDAFYI